jgi:Raf kinase inhibitor-like YbhB/YbcL family protein
MIKITSPVFQDGQMMPKKYTCDGEGISPPLEISDIPQDTKSLVLITDDPDAVGGNFNHWIVWNIDPRLTRIQEGVEPAGIPGINSGSRLGYYPPCPPTGTHRYIFKIFALDTRLDIPEGAEKAKIEKAMENHVIDSGQIIGNYSR